MSWVWKMRRLRAMSASEIMFRARRSAEVLAERMWTKQRARPARFIEKARDVELLPLDAAFNAEPYLQAADQIISGRWRVLGLDAADVGWPPRFNRDPKTGIEAARGFGKTLNYRSEAVAGNVKYLWEINRHAELVNLAQAFFLTRDRRYAASCHMLIDSWIDQCPHADGVNWSSSLEAAVRVVNWAIAWDLLGVDPAAREPLHERWLNVVYQHCRFIESYPSLYSSANNHRLGELMGLYVAAVCWPCWSESRRWRDDSLAAFEDEALKQNASDGVNREQAIYYQHEVADMMLLVGLIDRRHGRKLGERYWQRLEAMLEFIAAATDRGGNVPMIGDADDARLVRFNPALDASVYQSLLATGAALFRRPDFKAMCGKFDDKSRWLLGVAGEAAFDDLRAAAAVNPRNVFREGGYYFLTADRGLPTEVLCIADAGPLGYLSIAAHGHADALAFTLSAGGHPILIDPGTYAYHTEAHWRRYFRGTSAHNTARVDALDQSEQGGSFLWSSKAESRVSHWSSNNAEDRLIASHDGYQRLPDPVVHTRDIRLLKTDRLVEVADEFQCGGSHQVELHWHFSDQCHVEVDLSRCRVSVGPVRMEMEFSGETGLLQLFNGSDTLGWVSHRFDRKTPAPTLRWSSGITGTTRVKTTLRFSLMH